MCKEDVKYRENDKEVVIPYGDFMEAKSKMEFFLNIESEDKKKLINLINWANKAMEISVIEKIEKKYLKVQKGEVWTVDFGENVGSEMNNVRPCVIVNDVIDHFPLVTVCPITNNNSNFPSQISVNELGLSNFLTGTVKTEQIRTISKGRLGKKICDLSETAMFKLDGILLKYFGFDDKTIDVLMNQKNEILG